MAHDLKKKRRTDDVLLDERADFSLMLLSDRVLYGLTKAGFKTPSPIQLQAIPAGRFGKDLLVQAKSGTGKTLVFTVIALEKLKSKLFRPQVLILAPTREIATQICSVIKSVGSCFPKLTCYSFIGGLPVFDDKERALTCQIVVGTPGRVKQLITLGSIPTNSIRMLVLDEADELLQGTFKMEIDEIFKCLPKNRQVIATSATYSSRLRKIVHQYLKDAFTACLNEKDLSLIGIVHYSKVVRSNLMPLLEYKNKLAALKQLLTELKFCQCLIFCSMISRVEVLCKDVIKWGFSAAYISSAKEQSDRLQVIHRLKHYNCKVLVSSDITSRGIDAEHVDLVINFDLAFSTETYLHRVGRAGRYGSIGLAVSIITDKQFPALKKIEREAAFKSYILPEPLPKNLIRKPYFGEYTFELEEVADEENEKVGGFDRKRKEKPLLYDGKTKDGEDLHDGDALEQNDVKLKHNSNEEVEDSHLEVQHVLSSLVETASKNGNEVVQAFDVKSNMSKEKKPLTIVQPLKEICQKMNCVSLAKNSTETTCEKNGNNLNLDINDGSVKDTLSNDSCHVKDLESKEVNLTKSSKPNINQKLDIVYLDRKNSFSPVEVAEAERETNAASINPDFNCAEKETVMKDDSYKECLEMNEDNVNKKLDNLMDDTLQSSEAKKEDGKDSGLNEEKCLVKEKKEADNLNELNCIIKTSILNYESKSLENVYETTKDSFSVPPDGSSISNDMVKNLLSKRKGYVYGVFKEYEKDSVFQAPLEVELKTTEHALSLDDELHTHEESSTLKKECKKMCLEPSDFQVEASSIGNELELEDCSQKLNDKPKSNKISKDSEIINKKYGINIFESLNSSEDEFQGNYPKRKHKLQSTPVIKNKILLDKALKNESFFEDYDSENSDSDTVLSPCGSFPVEADVLCNRRFSSGSSSSDSDVKRSCSASSREKEVRSRKSPKNLPKYKSQQSNFHSANVPRNLEYCYSNSLSQKCHKKLPSDHVNTRRFPKEQRRGSTQKISNNPERLNFIQSSMPSRHSCQPKYHQHCTGCHPHATCIPYEQRHGCTGTTPRYQGTAKSSAFHCMQGARGCCASLGRKCHYQSSVASCSGGHNMPCCSSTAHEIPYGIFYQQWQYLQSCMNVPF